MAEKDRPLIVVKRIKKVAGGHHGGAWKVAYADFMTAMMAFFLLMWLLGSVDKNKLKGISEYFSTPLLVAMMGGSSVGQSAIILEGGGKDPNAKQPGGGDEQLDPKQALERAEASQMQSMKGTLEKLVESNEKLRPFKHQLLIDVTTEGLRVQIVDEKNRPMFQLARAEMEPYTREILRELAPALNGMPNRISLSGHTDATPYASGDKSYSNWELSAERANAARRVLVAGGLDEGRLMRVIGLASAVLLDPDNDHNPINRRISIIVLNKRAEDAARNEGSMQTTTLKVD
ncbi:flagellar motor protein MotB [Malikia sp.]|uniref:flagellar motor protein MotB n=1 Tax=Malikia sp. TaxID=2070706 RepID=UPI002616EF5D|nr:flagellar motor protein MotB [Malikia sp.]MDD2727902.1 flagellar motor protein MotB [Malikia sp.]